MTRLAHARCLVTGCLGLVLGVAAVAHGQDAPPPTVTTQAIDPLTGLLGLMQAGGLPAVLAGLGWLLGRGGGVPVTIQLHGDDRELLKRIARHIASDGPPTNPGVRMPLDESSL
jgi:hypothetical protein